MDLDENRIILFELQVGLEALANDHQHFDTWAAAILNCLLSQNPGRDDLVRASSVIVEVAVATPDCQYTFAKLCKFLDQSLPAFASDCLIPVLEEFLKENCGMLTDDLVKNLLMFMGEAYEQLEVEGSQSLHLSYLLCSQIQLLLSNGINNANADIYLKVVIQVLKLNGRSLEINQPNLTYDIFELLHHWVRDLQILSDTVKDMMWNLDELRETQWGLKTNEFADVPIQGVALAPTFAMNGLNAQALYEEELLYLDENYDVSGSPENNVCGSWNEELEQDGVFDDYETFLQATATRAAEKVLEQPSFDDDYEDSIIESPNPDREPRKQE